MPIETEIRLAATAAAMTRIPRSAALSKLAMSRPVTSRLVSVYWDTPSMSLCNNGVALRLRKSNDGSVTQTLKLQSSDAFARPEFEAATPGDRPHFALAIKQGWKADPTLIRSESDLRATFSTTVTRVSRTLTFPDGTTAELAFDRGRIRSDVAPEQEMPVREVEIELRSGDVRRLYELASELVLEVPGLHLQFASKSERGYRLVTGKPAPLRRARRVLHDRKRGAGRMAVSSAEEALSHVAGNADGTRHVANPDYVHQMHIGVRRLRSANTLAQAGGLPAFSDKLVAEMKWLSELLGSARDWDILESETWPTIKRATAEADGTGDIEKGISRKRLESHRNLRRALDTPRFARLMLAASWVLAHQRAAAEAPQPRKDVRDFARLILGKRQKRLVRTGQGLRELAPDERHQLRIDAKTLRYLGEFFADLYTDRSVHRYLRRLAKVQTALGALNDLTVSSELIKKAIDGHATADARALVVGLWDGHAAEHSAALEQNLRRAWKRFSKVPAFWV